MKLLETIRFENGEFANLELHQQRMNASRRELFNADAIEIENELTLLLQAGRPARQASLLQASLLQVSTLEVSQGLFKCRIIYSQQIEKIEFVPYQPPIIRSLKLVNDNDINYSHKYLDRSHLDKLFSNKGDCDDILITKNGLITDTSIANILFYNGKEWLTPARPLLKGTQRQFLLGTDQIITADIRPSDLKYFQKARLVNAMIRLEDGVDVQPNAILYIEN